MPFYNDERLIPTEDNEHPLLKLKGKERRKFAIYSLTGTVLITILLYIVPPYYGLEMLTTHTSYFFLDIFGFKPRYFTYEDKIQNLEFIDAIFYNLFDNTRATYPAIAIESKNQLPNYYMIIRACTGMQAGALLLGLIWMTPAHLQNKIKASYTVLIALFIGNALRIASMIAIATIFTSDFGVDHNIAWHYAHDWMGQPIGFFGTILFTIFIEKNDVRILDTITLWVDVLMQDVLGKLPLLKN